MGEWLRGRRTWWVAGGVVVVAVVLTSAGAYALTTGQPAASAKTSTAKVDRGEVATAVATTGILEPAQTRSLGFAASGTVTKVNVRAGDQAKAGQVLAEMDDAAALDKVDGAEEALDEAQDALDEAEDAADTATCPASTTTSPGYRLAALPVTTPTPSATGGAATPAPTVTVTVTVTVTETVTVAPSAAPTTRSSPSPSSGTNCANGGGASGGDAILSAEQKVTSAELALAEAKEELAGTKITAPIAGRVLTVSGSVGSDVSSGGTLVTLADVAGMQVAASFPEADAGRLATGLTATVTLADRPGEEFTARVVQVDPVGTADGDMVTYGAVLAFDEVPADLLVGQSAGVKVTTSSVADVLRVPSTAVGGTGTVLVRTPAGDAERSVEVGLRGDQYTEIKSGLIEGDEIVIAGS